MCVINHRKLENTDNYNWWSRALLPPLIRGCYWELQPVCTSASNNPWGFTMHDVIDCLAFENHTHLCSVSIGPHHSGWRGFMMFILFQLPLGSPFKGSTVSFLQEIGSLPFQEFGIDLDKAPICVGECNACTEDQPSVWFTLQKMYQQAILQYKSVKQLLRPYCILCNSHSVLIADHCLQE